MYVGVRRAVPRDDERQFGHATWFGDDKIGSERDIDLKLYDLKDSNDVCDDPAPALARADAHAFSFGIAANRCVIVVCATQ